MASCAGLSFLHTYLLLKSSALYGILPSGETPNMEGGAKCAALCAILLPGNIPQYGRGSHMNVEELKARLRALLHQRDMLRFERDSLELLDLLEEVDEEIRELQTQIRKIA